MKAPKKRRKSLPPPELPKLPLPPLSFREATQIVVETAKGPEMALINDLVDSDQILLHLQYGAIVKQTCYVILNQMGYSSHQIEELFTLR